MNIESENKEIHIYAVSKKGYELSKRIQKIFSQNAQIHTLAKYADKKEEVLETKLKKHVETHFQSSDLMIFIMATGICIRSIKDIMEDKTKDPAVIVIDECANHVISLLSGHIGRANEYTRYISEKLQIHPVITTATDLNDKWGVDTFAQALGLSFTDLKMAKKLTANILNEGPVKLCSDWDINIDLKNSFKKDIDSLYTLYLTNKNLILKDNEMQLYKKNLILGIGCKKNTPRENIENFVLEQMDLNQISINCIKSIASIDIKSEEIGLIELSQKYNWKFITYTSSELKIVADRFEGSEFVEKITGVSSVSEPSGYLASNKGKCLMKKKKHKGITLSIWEEHNE